MKILGHQTLSLFLLITCFCCISTWPQTKLDQRSSLNTVSGKVSIKGKGSSGIVVSLASVNSNGRSITYTGRTNQDGNYRIGNVPRGTYQIAPAAPGYGMPENQPRLLILAEGEMVDAIDFALVRGGVITGKVTTYGNQPLIEATISYTIERTDERGQSSRSTSGFQTDDRGIYRIFGLAPGKYKISAGPPGFSGQSGRFPQTYYPGTTDPAKATLVEVSEGGEVTTDINVELTDDSSQRFTVTGRTVDGVDGHPIPNISLRLQQLEQNSIGYLNLTSTSDGEGQFSFEDVGPGQYAVIGEPTPTSSLRAERVTFVVTDRAVTDLVVKTVRTSSMSGVVVLERTQNKTSLTEFGPLFLRSYSPSNGGIVDSAQVAVDGSFHMAGLRAGINNLTLGARFGPPPKGLTISRVERDGVVQSSGIEIKDDEIVTGVRVILKYSNGTISGSVKVANGELPPNAQVSVWLSNPQGQPRSFQTAPFVDSRGHFIIEGVADGTYEINATVMVPGVRSRTPTAKQQVVVSDGNAPETTLTVDLTPDPGVKP